MMIKEQLDQYESLYAQMIERAKELFFEYAKALPDQDDWHGYYGWRSGCGTISFDNSGIEYHESVSCRGESSDSYLYLPFIALWDLEWLPREVKRIEEKKLEAAEAKKKSDEEAEQKAVERDRETYERLKKRFEDPQS